MENEESYNTDIKWEMEETSAIDDDFSVQQSKDLQTNSSFVIESSTEGEPLQNYFYSWPTGPSRFPTGSMYVYVIVRALLRGL